MALIDALAAAIAADCPTLWWRLNETSGTSFADSSGNSYTGTLGTLGTLDNFRPLNTSRNTVVSDTGANNTNPMVSRAYDSALNPGTGDFTVEIWGLFKSSAAASGHSPTILYRDQNADGSGIIIATPSAVSPYNGLRVWIGGTVHNSTTVVWDDRLHHIMLTRASGSANLYVDGLNTDTWTASGSATGSANSAIYLGNASPSGASSGLTELRGSICDFAYTVGTALSSTRVAAHFNAGAIVQGSQIEIYTSSGYDELASIAYDSPSTTRHVVWRHNPSGTDTGYGGEVYYSSSIDGVTWSAPVAIATPPSDLASDFRDPCIVRTKSGRLLVTYFQYNWVDDYSTDFQTVYSDNNGSTWTGPNSIGSSLFTGSQKNYSSGPALQLANGNLLLPIYDNVSEVAVVTSTDNGITWGSLTQVANSANLTEMTMVQRANGTILAAIRQDSPAAVFTATSTNNGASWSSLTEIYTSSSVIGGRPALGLFTDSGDILLAVRGASPGVPHWSISQDGGTTWATLVPYPNQQNASYNYYQYMGWAPMSGSRIASAWGFTSGPGTGNGYILYEEFANEVLRVPAGCFPMFLNLA